MTLKSHILGGAAVIALACAGFVAPGIAQQAAPTTDQAAPATQTAQTASPAAAGADAAPARAPTHHKWKHARGHSSPAERAETQQLNQEQLARAQGGSQGQYGGAAPSDSNPPAPAPADQSSAPQPNDDGKMAPMNNTPPPPPPPDSTPKK